MAKKEVVVNFIYGYQNLSGQKYKCTVCRSTDMHSPQNQQQQKHMFPRTDTFNCSGQIGKGQISIQTAPPQKLLLMNLVLSQSSFYSCFCLASRCCRVSHKICGKSCAGVVMMKEHQRVPHLAFSDLTPQ